MISGIFSIQLLHHDVYNTRSVGPEPMSETNLYRASSEFISLMCISAFSSSYSALSMLPMSAKDASAITQNTAMKYLLYSILGTMNSSNQYDKHSPIMGMHLLTYKVFC
ncbi:hypothetical protein ANAPH2_01302 [Anaplasma phagocytophilum]|nr:hypothetical protein ANAPH2_00912 [Anaplasma phagocytophilum]SCV65560.1 hypothetical protein ANAPH2_01302 [Anaplasma phagocytophilum]